MLYLLSKDEMCNFEKYQNEKKGFHIKKNYLLNESFGILNLKC